MGDCFSQESRESRVDTPVSTNNGNRVYAVSQELGGCQVHQVHMVAQNIDLCLFAPLSQFYLVGSSYHLLLKVV